MTIKRYTVSVTRPIEAVEAYEDERGAFVAYRDVALLVDRVERARGLLGGAFVGPAGDLREKIGMALETLEGKR